LKKISPTCADTVVTDDLHEWIPTSFVNFLKELDSITEACSGDPTWPLFRGHTDRKYLLESTFARTCKKIIFNLAPHKILEEYTRQSLDHHLVLLNLFLLKFGVLMRPPEQWEELEEQCELDAWFEFMKEIQQFPEKDHPYLKGSFLTDWSECAGVALFFANKNRKSDGALWICDTVATGKTLQEKSVGEILDLMKKKGNTPKQLGCPLIFNPEKQRYHQQALNQKAVYIAQMDLRYDLAQFWNDKENENPDEIIYIKLILPNGTQQECTKYLLNKGITETYLFPTILQNVDPTCG